MPDLTPAEQAVAALFADDCIHEPGEPCTECDARGRRIVSVARPHLYREVRDRLTDECDSPQPAIYGEYTACEPCKHAHQLVQDLIDINEETPDADPA